MADSKKTTDHDTIKQWTEDRNGTPAAVKGTSGGDQDGEVIRIMFDENSKDNSELRKISWEEFFDLFDGQKLALLHSTEDGNTFNKLVSRD